VGQSFVVVVFKKQGNTVLLKLTNETVVWP
jgi:hypothetical protein